MQKQKRSCRSWHSVLLPERLGTKTRQGTCPLHLRHLGLLARGFSRVTIHLRYCPCGTPESFTPSAGPSGPLSCRLLLVHVCIFFFCAPGTHKRFSPAHKGYNNAGQTCCQWKTIPKNGFSLIFCQSAGCCWVTQCSIPPYLYSAVTSMGTISRSGYSPSRIPMAVSSFSSL